MNFQWIHLTYNISINYTLLITWQYTVNVHIFHYLLQQPQIECKSELDQPPDVASFFNADEKFSARSWLSIVGNISVISKIRNNKLKCTIHDVKIQLTIIIIIDFTNIILMPWLRDWSLDMLAYDSVTWYVSCRTTLVQQPCSITWHHKTHSAWSESVRRCIAVQFLFHDGGPKRRQSTDLVVTEHRRIAEMQGLENLEIWFFAKMAR